MNIRIQQFLAAENISQSQLADTLGVARASISHVVAGRNKPSFDFIESMSRNYPELNLDWLITGNGKMYKQQGSTPAFQQIPAPAMQLETIAEPSQAPIQETVQQPDPIQTTAMAEPVVERSIGNKSRKISKIVVFYDDNTFQEIQ